jgi:methyl-accepting chemotaxis protein
LSLLKKGKVKMKASMSKAYWTIVLGVLFPFLLFFVIQATLPGWRWVYEPLHSVLEALGFFAAMVLAIILLLQQDRKNNDSHYIWIACALISMGILDGFHASASPGNSFVFLHNLAVLVGGFLFCMVWLPQRTMQSQTGRRFAGLVAAGAIVLGVISIAFPQALPLMLAEGKFTSAASTINILGGIFFVLAAISFLMRYRTNRETEEILLAFFCFLNGSAGLLFPLGNTWGANWWLWHLLRLIAYLAVLVYAFSIFKDFKDLTELLEKSSAELKHLLEKVKEAVNVLTASSSEILAATTQVASGTAETATSINETTTTVEEVRQAAQLSSQKAQNVSDNAQRAAQVSQNGQKAVEETASGMDRIQEQMETITQTVVRLSEQSQSIGGIIASVTDLADQSNLLAVNAAIEAAKAGEQGKGFAVVAQEIKSLAEQSKQATAQVRGILSDVQKATSNAVMATEQGSKAVEAGVKQAAQAGEAIRVLAESIGEAVQVSIQIVASSRQQVVGMDQIGVAMENINQAGAQNAASMKQMEVAAQNLHELGEKLKELVAQFKV